MGVCPLPEAALPPVLILPQNLAPKPIVAPARPQRVADPTPEATAPDPSPAPGGRRIPELPGGRAPVGSPPPPPAATIDALDQLRFGPAIAFPECAPEGP